MNSRDLLIHLSVINNGDNNKIFSDIKAKRLTTEEDVAKSLNKVKDSGYTAVAFMDSDYPKALWEKANKTNTIPQLVLYYKDDKNNLVSMF